MPAIKCKCGGMTNTATSEHQMLFTDNNYATVCFAKYEKGVWVPGCGYEQASEFDKIMADSLIKGKRT